MTDHRLEWSPDSKTPAPEIVAAVDTVEARLTPIRFESDGAPVYAHQLPHFTIPVDADDRPLAPIISARDCELAGFDLADVIAAYRMEAR